MLAQTKIFTTEYTESTEEDHKLQIETRNRQARAQQFAFYNLHFAFFNC